MSTSTQVSKDDPLMIAWEAHKRTEEFANSRTWAVCDEHLDGALWAMFAAGWLAHESAYAKAPEMPAPHPKEQTP